MRRGVVLVLMSVLMSLTVAGCGSPVPDAGAPAPALEVGPLWGKVFLLDEATVSGEPHALVAGSEVTLRFTDDRSLVANAGCNAMSGKVSLDNGMLSVDEFGMTLKACPGQRQAQDTWLSDFLRGDPSWERPDESRLVLRGGDTVLRLTESGIADPDRPLVGTEWTVDSLVDGESVSSTPAGAPPATVRFERDQVEVFTGCNSGSAAYRRSGDTITVDALVLTRMACEPDIMRLESAVAGVLDGPVTVEVTSDVLSLDHPSGKGLRLRAE